MSEAELHVIKSRYKVASEQGEPGRVAVPASRWLGYDAASQSRAGPRQASARQLTALF